MAVATGQKTFEGGVARYIGVGVVKNISINPTKAELEKLFERPQENDPQYVGEADLNGEKVQTATIRIVMETIPEKSNGVESRNSLFFTLRNRRKIDSTGKKAQVIDEFGRTAWVTEEQFNAKSTVLTKKDGSTYQASISENYRWAYDGEDKLTDFIRIWLNIPNVTKFVNGKPAGYIDKPEMALVRLDNIASYFNGDFSEIKELLSYQPDNKYKIAFGVKTTDDNKLMQVFFNDLILPAGSQNFARLQKAIEERQSNNAYQNTEFEMCELKLYEVAPSTPAPSTGAAAPNPWLKK